MVVVDNIPPFLKTVDNSIHRGWTQALGLINPFAEAEDAPVRSDFLEGLSRGKIRD